MNYPRFTLGTEITAEQREFMDEYGFLHFKQVAQPDEVAMILSEVDRVTEEHLAAGRKKVRGIPLFVGQDHTGKKWIQRNPFTSLYSQKMSAFIHDPRFEPIRKLVGEDARIGEDECDGLVVNRYMNVKGGTYPRLGWHTDGLRDLFFLQMPAPYFNVGLHLDRCYRDNGGLRLIPGSHKQGVMGFLFKKPYFISHGEDPEEVCVETDPGDLTVHDGRLWHRVARSEHEGEKSLRRAMYVPYHTGPLKKKTEKSSTPIYHTLGSMLRRVRGSV
jgi:hypothetical protein